jgi:hypothetical protein
MATASVNLTALNQQFIDACYADAAECNQLGYDPHEFLPACSPNTGHAKPHAGSCPMAP